jgi:hypothetical protein
LEKEFKWPHNTGLKPAHAPVLTAWPSSQSGLPSPAHATSGVARGDSSRSSHATPALWRGRRRQPSRRGVRRRPDRAPVTCGRHDGQCLVGGEGVERRGDDERQGRLSTVAVPQRWQRQGRRRRPVRCLATLGDREGVRMAANRREE